MPQKQSRDFFYSVIGSSLELGNEAEEKQIRDELRNLATETLQAKILRFLKKPFKSFRSPESLEMESNLAIYRGSIRYSRRLLAGDSVQSETASRILRTGKLEPILASVSPLYRKKEERRALEMEKFLAEESEKNRENRARWLKTPEGKESERRRKLIDKEQAEKQRERDKKEAIAREELQREMNTAREIRLRQKERDDAEAKKWEYATRAAEDFIQGRTDQIPRQLQLDDAACAYVIRMRHSLGHLYFGPPFKCGICGKTSRTHPYSEFEVSYRGYYDTRHVICVDCSYRATPSNRY